MRLAGAAGAGAVALLDEEGIEGPGPRPKGLRCPGRARVERSSGVLGCGVVAHMTHSGAGTKQHHDQMVPKRTLTEPTEGY